MKTLKLSLVGAVLVLSIALPVLFWKRSEVRLRTKTEALRQQVYLTDQLAIENELLSNIVAQKKSAQALPEDQLLELLRLRNEAGQIRRALGETNQIQNRIRRTRDGLQDLAQAPQTGSEDPTALLENQTELRRARLDRLNRWLDERPEEKIPELKLLSEDEWLRSVGWTLINEEEYRSWISAQRGNAEKKFARIAFKAVKQYVRDNQGAFPADLTQLKSYFETPVEDAILQRYHIVPAKSLNDPFLNAVGGDWVITQKAPVNKDYDSRFVIGAAHYRGTLAPGRWADAP